jgi:hypothetical protein
MTDDQESGRPSITVPPGFCEYAVEACDQSFSNPPASDGLFLYPSDPEIFASTIEESVKALGPVTGGKPWLSLENL